MANEDRLIADNMGLVYKVLHKFKRAQDDDAMSLGMEALLKAIRTYDADKGVAFSTYATVCIYNAIGTYTRSLSAKKRQLTVTSYNDYISGTEGDTFEDIIGTKESLEDEYIRKEQQSRVFIEFDAVLNTLSDKAKEVIIYWRDSDYTATQVEIGEAVGVSQSYACRVLSTFRHKLRMKLEE